MSNPKIPSFIVFLTFAMTTCVFADGYAGNIQVRVLLKTDTTALGRAVEYPDVASPEVTAIEVTIPPGAETGWHRHSVPWYAYVVAGSLELEVEGGVRVALKAGQAYAELVGVRHNGRNTGNDTVKLVAFFTGEKGKPFTIRE